MNRGLEKQGEWVDGYILVSGVAGKASLWSSSLRYWLGKIILVAMWQRN